MNDINPQADIHVSCHNDVLTVTFPLVGPVREQWRERYEMLARMKKLPARVLAKPRNAYIQVTVPASTGRAQVFALLDAARTLITEAGQPGPAAEAETAAREWWSRQKS